MTQVVVMTEAATYRGELDLSTPGGQDIRLLDALNTPSRLRFGAGQAEPSLRLTRALRRSRRDLSATPCGTAVILRPTEVLAAYEDESETREHEAVYERRQAIDEEPVLIHCTGNLRLEGVVRGGVQTLQITKVTRPFVACTNVLLLDLETEAPPVVVPFMGFNLTRVESYGPAPGRPSKPLPP
jgi:hypothetical protein